MMCAEAAPCRFHRSLIADVLPAFFARRCKRCTGTFLPQFVLGYLGMPRRYHQYPPEFQVLNVRSSAGASILAVGYLLPFAYLFDSLRWGEPAGPNPWHATGLEWQTPSPPPKHNFEETPVVTRGPYEYATEGGDAR
jgi:cytochrome c oxidase subunit 1